MRVSIRSVSLSAALVLGGASSLAHADETVTTTTTSSTSGNNVPTAAPNAELTEVSDPGEPQMESGISQRTFPNRPLLATGSVLLVSSYVPAVIGAAISDRSDTDKLYIPVAGPWMTLKQGESEKPGHKALLVADGAVQGLGALMMVTSLFIPERTTKNWYLIGSNEKVRLAPHGAGLAALGRF